MNTDNSKKPVKLALAERYLYEGLCREAFALLIDIEKSGELTDNNRIHFYNLKSESLIWVGHFREALITAERAIREYIESESKLLLFDALYNKTHSLIWLMKYDEVPEPVSLLEDLLIQITDESPSEIAKRTVFLNRGKAYLYWNKNDTVRAKEYFERNLEISEKYGNEFGITLSLWDLGRFSVTLGKTEHALEYMERSLIVQKTFRRRFIPRTLAVLCAIYWQKGDFDRSTRYQEDELKNALKNDDKSLIAGSLNNLGMYYKELGELERAKDYLERALAMQEEFGFDAYILYHIFGSLFEIGYEMNDLDVAQIYLQRCISLDQEIKKGGSYYFDVSQRVMKAMMLKKSSRIVARSKAQEIFKEIVNEKIIDWEFTEKAFLASERHAPR